MPASSVEPGLCAACLHAERVQSARGSTFILCARSRTDTRFARYPRLPVVRCPGYEKRSVPPPPTDHVNN